MVRKKIRKWDIVLEVVRANEGDGGFWGMLQVHREAVLRRGPEASRESASTSRVGKVLLVQDIVGWGLDRKSSKIAVGKDVGVAEKGQGCGGPLPALNTH